MKSFLMKLCVHKGDLDPKKKDELFSIIQDKLHFNPIEHTLDETNECIIFNLPISVRMYLSSKMVWNKDDLEIRLIPDVNCYGEIIYD